MRLFGRSLPYVDLILRSCNAELSRCILKTAVCCAVCSFLSFNAIAKDKPIRVGISEFAEYSVNLPIIPATVRLLEDVLGKENVEAKVYSVANLQAAAKAGQVDVILSSAGTYRRLAIEGAGVRDIATVVSTRAKNPNFADGSVFFVKKDRDDINVIADLKGKTIAATHQYAFSGWQTALGELLRRNLPYESFFGGVIFKGHDMPFVVTAVENSEVDAGIVRACFLEDMDIDMSQFKILDPMPNAGKIDCIRSTELYPNWTFSTLPSTSPEDSRRIAAALLSMPPIENGLHWSLATDFRAIDQLFLDLKIGPYEYLKTFSLWRFIHEYSLFFTAALTLMIALILHSATVSRLVRRRTKQLEESLERERALEEETHIAQARYSALQKIGIVGQMSSIIAHELHQPLASISMYCYGLLRRIENGNDDVEKTRQSLEKMAAQTQRASDIVDQVREYSKGRRERSAQNVCAIAKLAVESIRKSTRRSQVEIVYQEPKESFWIEANALEIELVVVNLLKNAVDANAGRTGAYVELTIARTERGIRLTVIDNGAPISDENWESILLHTVRTTKQQGLGLGLSIVCSIVEDLGGRVIFNRPTDGGLRIDVLLDLLEEHK